MDEHKIPSTCPECSTLLAAGYENHCGDRWCGWISCNHCSEVICTRSGRHNPGTKRPT